MSFSFNGTFFVSFPGALEDYERNMCIAAATFLTKLFSAYCPKTRNMRIWMKMETIECVFKWESGNCGWAKIVQSRLGEAIIMRHKVTRIVQMNDAHAEFWEDKTTFLYVSLKVQSLESLVFVTFLTDNRTPSAHRFSKLNERPTKNNEKRWMMKKIKRKEGRNK